MANAVVSAVGQLNRPNMPDIAGLERFEGRPSTRPAGTTRSTWPARRSWSSAPGPAPPSSSRTWPEAAADLTIIQRTPAWFLPTPDYHDDVEARGPLAPAERPGYANWLRFWLFWRNVEGLMSVAAVDPEWDGGEQSVSLVNE